jgi:hypothetical protein
MLLAKKVRDVEETWPTSRIALATIDLALRTACDYDNTRKFQSRIHPNSHRARWTGQSRKPRLSRLRQCRWGNFNGLVDRANRMRKSCGQDNKLRCMVQRWRTRHTDSTRAVIPILPRQSHTLRRLPMGRHRLHLRPLRPAHNLRARMVHRYALPSPHAPPTTPTQPLTLRSQSPTRSASTS